MKVLVTGANGFAGHYLVAQLLEKSIPVIATGKGPCRLPFTGRPGFEYADADLTIPGQLQEVFDKHAPGTVVHAGANGKPDECEQNREMAYEVNVTGTGNILTAAAKHRAFVIFISTDFIFPGTRLFYKENDDPGPVNYYGETKRLAEALVNTYPYDHCIIRTILVYGKPLTGRGNLLTVVKDKLTKGEIYNVYNDQVRTPTYVEDLAAAIVAVIQKRATGIYHIGGRDVLTPYQVACKVAAYFKLDSSLLNPVTRDNFSQPALRPLITGLDISKAQKELGYNPVSFEAGLIKTFS